MPNINRRELAAMVAGYLVSVVVKPISDDKVVKIWDELVERLIRDDDPGYDLLRLVGSIFSPLSSYSLVPGNHNVDAFRHPDIFEPLENLVPFWSRSGHQVETIQAENLMLSPLDRNLLLIGGPVSNLASRHWRGMEKERGSGFIKRAQPSAINARWEFVYDFGKGKSEGIWRYVDGRLHQSWPQAIIDVDTPHELKEAGYNQKRDGPKILQTDRLLITFALSPFSGQQKFLIDVADLHGKGNEAFARLLRNKDDLLELKKVLSDHHIYSGDPFQVLYDVHVEHHDHKTTIAAMSIAGVQKL